MNHLNKAMTRGELLFQAGNLEEARVVFEQIVQENPLHYEAINNLGTILYTLGDMPSAERCFQKAFSLKGDDIDTLLNLADLYFSIKRWNEAASFLERYIHLTPRDCVRLNQLALTFMESGDQQRAIPVLEKSLEIQPNQEDIQNILKTLKYTSPMKSVPIKRNHIPVVSVGLPVHNGGKLLPQAIESILAQDLDDFELIISDNCSTDETTEVCLDYQRRDQRVRYYRFDENRGVLINFLNVLGLAEAPFFMWASHDDLREKKFMSACLAPFYKDPSIALVYPHAKILDNNSHFQGIAMDQFMVNQESPIERFKHLIWGLGMCNSFYGIFRSSILKKVKSWWTSMFIDTLVLAEITLLGKIVQIEEPLFVRRLTDKYNYNSFDDRIAKLLTLTDQNLLNEGITFPHSRWAYAHLELLNQSNFDEVERDALMKEVLNCFRTRWGAQMKYEIDRAITLINNGHFYCQWNHAGPVKDSLSWTKSLMPFHISSLLKRLQEAMFFFPEREDLSCVYRKCCDELCKLHFTP